MKKNINYWLISSMFLLLLVSFLSGYLIKEKIASKPKSMQSFYNIGWNEGTNSLLKDICDDKIVYIKGKEIPLDKLCEK